MVSTWRFHFKFQVMPRTGLGIHDPGAHTRDPGSSPGDDVQLKNQHDTQCPILSGSSAAQIFLGLPLRRRCRCLSRRGPGRSATVGLVAQCAAKDIDPIPRRPLQRRVDWAGSTEEPRRSIHRLADAIQTRPPVLLPS